MTDTGQGNNRHRGTEGWGDRSTKTVEWFDPMATATAGAKLAGIDFLRAVAEGRLPPAPIAVLTGMRMVEIESQGRSEGRGAS